MIIIWVLVILGFIVLELMTPTLITLNFSIAGLFALIAALLGANVLVQLIIFTVVLSLSFMVILPFLRKLAGMKVAPEEHTERTNLDLVIGEVALCVEPISFLKLGSVKIDGKVWTAQVLNEADSFNVGDQVRVDSISGVKIIVKKVEE